MVNFIPKIITVLSLSWLLQPYTAEAKMFSYKDDKGTLHFVDSPAEIPKKYRATKGSVETERDQSAAEKNFSRQVFANKGGEASSVQLGLQQMTAKFQELANSSNFKDAEKYMTEVVKPFIKDNVGLKRRGASADGLNQKQLLQDLDGAIKNMRARQIELDRIMRSDDSTNR